MIAASAQAQDSPDRAACSRILDNLPLIAPAVRAAIVVTRPDPQTCRFGPIRFGAGTVGWQVDSLTVAGIETGGTIAPMQPVRITAKNVRNSLALASPVGTYLAKVAATPFDIVIEFVSDPVARRLNLREASMRGELLGAIQLAASLTDIVIPNDILLGNAPEIPDPVTPGLTSLSFRLDNRSFVERMVTPAIIGFIASSGPQADPEPIIEAQKTKIAGLIDLVGLPPETAYALQGFVTDFPHPTGSLQCSFAAEPPVHLPANGRLPDLATIRALLAAAHPTCTYTRL